jgi:hypothetical protein
MLFCSKKDGRKVEKRHGRVPQKASETIYFKVQVSNSSNKLQWVEIYAHSFGGGMIAALNSG